MLDDSSIINLKLSERDSTAANKPKENIDRPGNNDDLKRLGVVDVLKYTSKIWKGQEPVAEAVTSETVRILRKAHEKCPLSFWDKSRERVLGGLFYSVGRRMNVAKTQKQIARCLDTDEMTIRNSYREWLGHFPEFWPEAPAYLKERYGKKSKPPCQS